jgi:hypothetical protein
VKYPALALTGALVALAAPAHGAKAVRPEGFQACHDIYFYNADEDPNGLNIRSGPGLDFRVLGTTRYKHLFMTEFAVIGSQDGWFKIRPTAEWDYRNRKLTPLQGYAGEGWVAATKLEMTYYAGDQFDLHKRPGSKESQHIFEELEVSGPQKLISCQGDWVQIEHSEWTWDDDPDDAVETVYSGWIPGKCVAKQRCPFLPTGGMGGGGARNFTER